jgi:D-alanyl-D-alanine carboxypeptidase (penicillin-binding protein 5/6)
MTRCLFAAFASACFTGLAILPIHAQEAFMVMEAYSGKVLAAANSTQQRPVASLTKIATASVVIDWANAVGVDLGTTELTVPQTASLVGGPNPLNLQPGDRMTLRDALYASLLASDNLAALSLADHVGRELVSARGKNSDPVAEFVGEMNKLAKALGMASTKFGNPHGLEREGLKAGSTAADMARLSVHAMRRNAFNYIVRQSSRTIRVKSSVGDKSFAVKNTNQLIGEDGVLGIKTGTTAAAGECLSFCIEREPLVRTKPDGEKGVTPRRLMIVLLNSPDRFGNARKLAARGWAAYDTWLDAGAPVADRRREIISVPDIK